ncbi:endonuclease/exonuclease/phosphatase family protein [Vibrio sp. Isolate24]|uniref:endonuclease/exonuclease/phosphatase family protein n=1 Tax=Vibrio sp. Isolate24 TaxID=2908534 RepID=UPI001EFEC0B3|nr:endonuclease/exonuclease/phosphatase family protein [Vibrio sp. Isolate24]MCG9677552.1 endonuclease/exonuclease/phosphatase family protein [Vibrio sp. Isolate24]
MQLPTPLTSLFNKRSLVTLSLMGILVGCDEDVIVEQETRDLDIPPRATNFNLTIGMDFDNPPTGSKVDPQNVGKKYPVNIEELGSLPSVTSFDGSLAKSFTELNSLRFSDLRASEHRTVSFWFKLEEDQPEQEVLSLMNGSHGEARSREPVLLLNTQNDTLELWRKYEGTQIPDTQLPTQLLSGVKVPRGEWVHITMASNQNSTHLYLNGNRVATGAPIALASMHLAFGASPGYDSHLEDIPSANMAMDNIRVYSQSMGARYINALYHYDLGERHTLPTNNPVPSTGTTGVTTTDTRLQWSHPDEFKAEQDMTYTVLISDRSDFSNVLYQKTTTDKEIQTSGLLPDTQYFWRVDVESSSSTITGDTWQFTTEAAHQNPDELTTMAYNIWHAGSAPDPLRSQEYVYEQIIHSGADVIFMQEAYGYQEALANRLGFEYRTSASDGNLAIFSRYPIEKELGDCTSHICGVRIDMGNGKQVDTYSIWLTSSDDIVNLLPDPSYTNEELISKDDAARAQPLNNILTQIEADSEPTIPVIIGGDFNTLSYVDTTEETNIFGRGNIDLPTLRVADSHNYVDSYRQINPDVLNKKCITWTPFFKGNSGAGRIDFILYKGEGLNAEESYCLLDDGHSEMHPSDHGAVVTQFSID